MNNKTNGITFHFGISTFKRRDKDKQCQNGHDWKVLITCDSIANTPGIALCTVCATLEGGWVTQEDSTDE